AAIDFLLLADGHGCKNTDRLCCMNLSGNSSSVRAQIQKLRTLAQHLVEEDTSWNPFAGW
ncbi:hypothetical protein N302_15734, partial [Corvus brachyrhynchos]